MDINAIRDVLTRQAQTMLTFGEAEQELQRAVIDRDWNRMERLVAHLEQLSRDAESLDAERHDLIMEAKSELGVNADASFPELLERLPASDREDLTALFRSLQISVLRVKGLTRGIDSYVRGSLRTSNEMLGTVFPDQKGTLYSRRGRRAPADGRAMVLDRRL